MSTSASVSRAKRASLDDTADTARDDTPDTADTADTGRDPKRRRVARKVGAAEQKMIICCHNALAAGQNRNGTVVDAVARRCSASAAPRLSEQ